LAADCHRGFNLCADASVFFAPRIWVRHLKKYAFWQGYAEFLKDRGEGRLQP
jgi:hypothetical protein